MKIQVNGEIKFLKINKAVINLKNVVELLGHDSQLVVVEYNGIIRPPQSWNEQEVKEGDILEIVTIVGGGS